MKSTDVHPAESLEGLRAELLPQAFRNLWEKIDKRYWDMSEPELRQELRAQTGPEQKNMSLMVRMRIVFWNEYEKAAYASQEIKLNALYRGVCRNDLYWGLIGRYPAFFPWMLCPLAGYLLQRKELEFLAEERMLEIMSVSAVRPDGKIDSRLAKVQLEMYQTIQDRNYGPVIQKIQSEQKNLNVNVDASAQEGDTAARAVTLISDISELNRRLEEVRKKREALSTVVQPVTIDQQRLIQPEKV